MSYTTILGVTPDTRPVTLLELRNARGWAPSIWDRLTGTRLAYFRDDVLGRLWQGIEGDPLWRQVPNVLTFDTGVVPAQAFGEAADALDEFERRLPAPEGHVNHVPEVAALLRSRPEVPFVGVWGTSVSENPFDPWDVVTDEPGCGIALGAMYLLGRWWRHVPGYADALAAAAGR
jgi:hypothetical protein